MASASLIFHVKYLFLSLIFFFMSSVNSAQAITQKSIMINQFLSVHNAARKAVGVPPLKWEPKLATYARVYSNERRKDCRLVHSPGFGYGENLFWGQGRRWTAKDATAAWVAEKQWYHYDDNSCTTTKDCSHYTQIVWRTTERVGCSKIICDSGNTFIACEYYPPGNYIGERPY